MSSKWGSPRAFLGLGSNAGDPPSRLAGGLARLVRSGVRVAAVSRAWVGPYVGPSGPDASQPPVWNAVAEVHTPLAPEALLALLLETERAEGRDRSRGTARTLDLDLLDVEGERRATPALTLPHPRALDRAFVLAPWEDVAPLHVPSGAHGPVAALAARLCAARPEAFAALEARPRPDLPPAEAQARVLADRAALRAWRDAARGAVGVVMTMGALHEGHASHVRRARAENDAVLATVFVNPLQFGPSEDLARYPRTLDADLALLRDAGADAVYVPSQDDLYPPGFATHVAPSGPAEGYEGAARPGHFRGVATVVEKLWQRTRPDRAYFGRKDAQQAAVVRGLVRDLDLPGEVVVGPTTRDPDGLAMSSRNRYLTGTERARALALPRALEAAVLEAARGAARGALVRAARERMESAGLAVEYVDVVDPDAFTPAEPSDRPSLVVAVVRAGATRLLDNRWVVGRGP